jgi:ankyrin repeat protein
MLHKAAASNNGQLVTFALAFGLLPDFSDKDGETPIHKAVKHSYLNILGPLLENHSRVGPRRVLTMMTNRDGNIPSLLVSAAHASDSDVLELLVTSGESARYHLDPEGESESPLTLQYTEALQAAAANGSEGCSWLLLKKGADVHYRNAAGETALHLAAKNGHEKVILLLLQKGSDIHATTTISGESPLHLAASRGSTAAVHALLEKGATADGKAITCAASSGDTATMKLILRAQVSDVDGAKSATLATISALHQTVQTCNDSMVRVLLANATDIIHSRTTSVKRFSTSLPGMAIRLLYLFSSNTAPTKAFLMPRQEMGRRRCSWRRSMGTAPQWTC